ncbi:hypothetical protein EM20IM_08660 [Candidatus Methylacidiphilum infernorum]|uniref:Uncharacterized protein n=1 Tax=Candidatus Methylacidiphilum infernorum TaxID=511746 RepID=A0ABX7PUZ3_9BACT|nr:hypothetical protein [Candidatus Methylacidiphilum infernorum]QSR86548.1 hypothetical protein EM20IM_08660 [Candidatus Methylacidiphilum infernorum]
MSILAIFLAFYFFASYYEKQDDYYRLFLTQKPGSPIKEPHIFCEERGYVTMSPAKPMTRYFCVLDDPKFPTLWVKCWLNNTPVYMRRYRREEANKKVGRNFPSYADYIWLSDIITIYGGFTFQSQSESIVLPNPAFEKRDMFSIPVFFDRPINLPVDLTVVLDLGQMYGVIPGIGKTTSPYFLQWSYGQFFHLSPPGYRLFGSRAYWQWQNIYHIDQKIQAEWYAWYR